MRSRLIHRQSRISRKDWVLISPQSKHSIIGVKEMSKEAWWEKYVFIAFGIGIYLLILFAIIWLAHLNTIHGCNSLTDNTPQCDW
jgi:hypothetical protein